MLSCTQLTSMHDKHKRAAQVKPTRAPHVHFTSDFQKKGKTQGDMWPHQSVPRGMLMSA